MKTPQQIVDEWNEKYPVGTFVKYRSILGGPVTLTAKTEHPAQLLGGHTPTLWLVGHLGAYALSHCEPVGGDQ